MKYHIVKDITIRGRECKRGDILSTEDRLEGLVDSGFLREVETATREKREATVGFRERFGRKR